MSVSACASPSGTLSREFDQANKLYEEGKFAGAVTAYEKLIKDGNVSATFYFNLANALFKSGRNGQAIVWYRRAEVLAPRDPDIQANLHYLRKNITGSRVATGWRRHFQKLSLNEWTTLTMAAAWLWFALLIWIECRPVWKSALRGYTATAGSAAGLLGICLAIAAYEITQTKPAVVVVQEAVVRRGPLEESPSFYSLRDGSEIMVLDQKDDWLLVTDSGQRTGWLRRDQVILVHPSTRT